MKRMGMWLLLVLWIGAAAGPAAWAQPEEPAVAAVGLQAPDFTLQTVDGREVSLSDLRGSPTVLYFWATWCVYCQAGMPVLNEKYLEAAGLSHGEEPPLIPDRGFAVLAVNLEESAGAVERFMQGRGLTFPALLDPGGRVSYGQYLVWLTPTLYFIDREGVIRGRWFGPISPELFDEKLALITEG